MTLKTDYGMRKNMVRWGTSATMLLTALPLGLVINAQGASFDCDKALTEVEKTICTKPELSILDEDLDRAYKEAQKKAQDSAALKEQQRNWLKERDLCKDASCLHEKYRQRIAALNQVITGFPTIFPADVSEFDIDCTKAKSFAEKLICKQTGSP